MKLNQRWGRLGSTLVVAGLGCGGSDAGNLFDSTAAAPDAPRADSEEASRPSAAPSEPPAESPPSAAGNPGSLAEGNDTSNVARQPPAPPSDPAAAETPSDAPSAEPPDPADEPDEPEQTPCTLGAFGVPEKLSGLALDQPLWGPALSLMDTALFFAAGSGPEQLFVATRADSSSAQFSAASPLIELASDAFDGTPFVGASGLRLYFYSTRAGSNAGSRDLWVAERPTLATPFGPATPITELNSPSFDLLPRLSADELRILFVSQRPEGKGRTDIWQAQRAAVGEAFAAPENVAELNTDADDTGPWLASDGLTIFFASNRAGGQGGLDFWRATRASTDAPFDPAEVMAELNTPGEELDIAFSSTEREILFSSDRDGAVELWRAVRQCL